MKRRQTERFDFEEPETGAESLALYAWAGIAAMSALAACITFLMPIDGGPIEMVETRVAPEVETVAEAPKPDIVAPAQQPFPDTAVIRETATLDDTDVDELLEKYGQKTDDIDQQTTAAVTGEVEENPVEELQPVQPFPAEDALGATIGLSQSVPELAQRYAALERRAPDLFETIEPLVEVVEDGDRLEARLIAGPFAAREDLSAFCRALRLRITVDCVGGDYSGEPLTR